MSVKAASIRIIKYSAQTFEEVVAPLRIMRHYPVQVEVAPLLQPGYETNQFEMKYEVWLEIYVPGVITGILGKLSRVPKEQLDSVILSRFFWESQTLIPYDCVRIAGCEDTGVAKSLTWDNKPLLGVNGFSVISSRYMVALLSRAGIELKPALDVEYVAFALKDLYNTTFGYLPVEKEFREVYTALLVCQELGNSKAFQPIQEYVIPQNTAVSMQLLVD